MSQNQLYLRETQQIGEETEEWLVTPTQAPTLGRYGITLVGWSQARVGFRFVRLSPHYAHVLLTVAGQGQVRVGSSWHEVQSGDLYLSPARALSAYHASEGNPWTLVWAHVQDGTFAFPDTVSVVKKSDPFPLLRTVQGLYDEANGLAEPEPLADWSRLVFSAVRRSIEETHPSAQRLRPLWQAVQADLAEAWTRDALASRMGISGEQLRRLCQEAHGCSPMAYVTRLRMQHAASLLASGRYSVAEVGFRVGYDNPFAFSTAFKRLQGAPPASFLPRRR